jgi:hypothetical protein
MASWSKGAARCRWHFTVIRRFAAALLLIWRVWVAAATGSDGYGGSEPINHLFLVTYKCECFVVIFYATIGAAQRLT